MPLHDDTSPSRFGEVTQPDAVLGCLNRCGPRAVRVAHGLAVLDERATPARLARLLELEPDQVTGDLRRLNRTGKLAGGRFRHPVARIAVLDSLAEDERSALHLAAADLLHGERAPAAEVCAHLLAAQSAERSWAVPALHEAAEAAVREGRPARALACLRLAEAGGCGRRAVSVAILARAEWRTDPTAVARRLPRLVQVISDRQLDPRQTLDSTELLLWFGYDRVVAGELARLGRIPGGWPADVAERLAAARSALALCYPGAAVREVGDSEAPTSRTAALLDRLRSVHGAVDPGLVTSAEQLLQTSSLLEESTVTPSLAALTVLIAAERLSTAEFWCDVLISEAETARTAPWQALFAGIKADLALRRGDLRAARAQAESALGAVSAEAWGVGIGLPLAVLAQLDTVAGRPEPAAARLRTPVPEALSRTPFGWSHLRARGRHLYATARHQEALDVFESVGRLMRDARLDHPALVPWRTDAAQALLALGRDDDARALAEEQLARSGDGAMTARAAALRVLAACSEPTAGAELLGKAVAVLQESGDQVELAHVLTDLSRLHDRLGHVGQARMMRRRAEYVAGQAGVDRPLHLQFPPVDEHLPQGAGWADGQPVGLSVELSGAERRVAALAARGHINRQIAEDLCITVSTVEQHLTRVYRKLGVRGRADLPVRIKLGSRGDAGPHASSSLPA
jgi:DNA-binding CsgD family transcriptional regulator/tetratricopeptide (TPR) repeat protein